MARSHELAICRYRILPQTNERPAVTAVARAWTQYQALFSSVYDAVIGGPTKRANSEKQALAQTQFAFAYTFDGPIGVVLTLPGQSVNGVTSNIIQQTAQIILEIVRVQSQERLAAFVKSLGVAPISKLADWTDAHLALDAGAGVTWEISTDPQRELLIQVQEFKVLKQAIEKIGSLFIATS